MQLSFAHCTATANFEANDSSKNVALYHRQNFYTEALCIRLAYQVCRPIRRGGAGVPWQPQILADQLTLFQPRGADYAHQIILEPPDFQTLRRP